MQEKIIFYVSIFTLVMVYSCSNDNDCPDPVDLSLCDQSIWLGEWEPLNVGFDPDNKYNCVSSFDLVYDSTKLIEFDAGSSSRKLIVNIGFQEYTIYDLEDCNALEIGDDLVSALFANTRYRLIRDNLLEQRSRYLFFAVITRYYRRVE